MRDRLSAVDASFLYLEKPASPMHVAGVLVLEPPRGGLDAIASLVEARLPLVPPGWSYSNTNYILAGLIIEKVTGHDWQHDHIPEHRRCVHEGV